jgi:cyclopropane fatty-acyl-phospholipid synthase-like methyltransferase
MKAADEGRDYRPLVARSYDAVAGEFNATRRHDAVPELAPLLARLAPGSHVLDLGCGTDAPIARSLLAAGHDVVGVEMSAGQMALAHVQAPGARLIRADMSRVAFRPGSFDAVVSFYAIFHLPLAEHRPLFARAAGWLRPGGWLLATLSPEHEEGYTEDYFGRELYWSNLSLAEYRAALRASGFDIESEGSVGHGYDDERAKPERHPLILARRGS